MGAEKADQPRRHSLSSWALIIGVIGVVYGDIGTSPLYTVQAAFNPKITGLTLTDGNILGFLSMLTWSVILTVSVKYVSLILYADNRGEGGVLSLATLAVSTLPMESRRRTVITTLAILGLALFMGDGMITPAVTVLSAVEGLELSVPAVQDWIVPISVLIILGLFLFQSRGTHKVGGLFGPVMMFWFLCLALLGMRQIIETPEVLMALNPLYAFNFAVNEGIHIFFILGAVVLSFTGAEALYADIGHFGRKPIQQAWALIVFPALIMNYYGQGAFLLRHPEGIENPFFLMAPTSLLLPLVILSTAASVIASQAVISGVFSLTRQAVQLGYLPRMEIRHTFEEEIGQIYVPQMNWILMVSVIALVFMFKSSAALTDAYGLAVTATMLITTMMAFYVARHVWKWPYRRTIPIFSILILVDAAFFSANCLKILEGGWLPLAVGLCVFTLISTWRRGRKVLYKSLYTDALPTTLFLERADHSPVRVSGTAVFMTGDTEKVPLALLHNLKHNKVLHERIILMQVKTEEVPWVRQGHHVTIEKLGKGFHRVVARFGFMETPNVPRALTECRALGLMVDLSDTSFFISREELVPSHRSPLYRWQESLFIALSATAQSATTFFGIPSNRVVILGAQVEV